jgi:hypothetical protein
MLGRKIRFNGVEVDYTKGYAASHNEMLKFNGKPNPHQMRLLEAHYFVKWDETTQQFVDVKPNPVELHHLEMQYKVKYDDATRTYISNED